MYQVLFFSKQVFGHPAIALPAISTPVLTCTGYHIAPPAIVTNSTPRYMIDNYPITAFKSPASGACLHNLATWFMAGYHSRLISFGSLPQMLMINAPDIGTTAVSY